MWEEQSAGLVDEGFPIIRPKNTLLGSHKWPLVLFATLMPVTGYAPNLLKRSRWGSGGFCKEHSLHSSSSWKLWWFSLMYIIRRWWIWDRNCLRRLTVKVWVNGGKGGLVQCSLTLVLASIMFLSFESEQVFGNSIILFSWTMPYISPKDEPVPPGPSIQNK